MSRVGNTTSTARLIEQHPGRVLDVGCGTGRLLIPYLAAGIDIEGVDSSKEMLSICRKKARRKGLNATLYEQRMQTLDLANRYSSIIVPGGSFHLITEREEAAEALKRFNLDDLEVVYMWVDGAYAKAGLEKEKAAVLVVMAALSDGSKVAVSTVPGYRESTESWPEVLRDIKRRGLSCPRLVVGDGHLGIWGALRNVYPQAAEQRCWNRKIVNVLAKLPKRQQDQAKLMLRTIPYAPTRTEAERLRTVFTRWCGDHSYEAASEALERTGTAWPPSMISQRSTGGTFARRTQWNHPSRPSGFGQTPPSATRGSIGR